MNKIPENYTLNNEFEELITVYEREQLRKEQPITADTIKVNFVVSAAASIYEVIRNAVEYREQHLLHRAAIERILKRLTYLQNTSEDIAEALIRELIWARYLENEKIPETKIKDIATVIAKYLSLWHVFNKSEKENQGKRGTYNFLLTLASCEIEENLDTYIKREAIFNFTYLTIRPHIDFNPEPFQENEKELLISVALRKALLKSDVAMLSFALFNLYYPEWRKHTADSEKIVKELIPVQKKIKEILESKVVQRLFYYCRNNIPPFLMLQDALEKNPTIIHEKAKNSATLNKLIEGVTKEKYKRLHKKITSATTRSIIYIFLTKMLIAFIVEFPYEKFIVEDINYRNLLINLILPPAIMFFITLTIRVPGEKNTLAIQDFVRSIVYKDHVPKIVDYKKKRRLQGVKRYLFGFFYSIGFVATFGLILYFLIKLQYNFISGAIFVLFLTLVSFFGFMIRQQIRDINLLKATQSGIATITDFFSFPIISTGSMISTGFAKFNITVYIFDVFLEAPFKTVIQIFEEWFHFIRDRKDEIV